MNASAAPSIGLQKVVISTSSMHSSVLSGFLSASMIQLLSVVEISALTTHLTSSSSAVTSGESRRRL